MNARIFGLFGLLMIALALPAQAGGVNYGSVKIQWVSQQSLQLTVTPNFQSGFGAVPAKTGVQPTPIPGGGASLGGGAVDFGNVAQGVAYLYRYAAHVNVATNAPTFLLYAEGSADFTGTGAAAGSTLPIPSTIFWLNSSGSNTGFSPSTPFQKTTQPGAAYNNPSIMYGSYPTPIYTSSSGTADLFFDYQLKLSGAATLGPYFVYIVYTAVPQ